MQKVCLKIKSRTQGENMEEAAAQPAYQSLETFLDTLPKQPCETQPGNKYYCTVCERLNKPVAGRCQYSKLKSELTQPDVKEGADEQIKTVSDQEDSSSKEATSVTTTDTTDKVEFKVVTAAKTDEDYPLIELVQPKDKKIEPIEMQLLEDVAIEFEISNDEPIEVEAIEVEPVDDYDEDYDEDYDDEDTEGSVVETISIEETGGTMDSYPEFKPLSQEQYVEPKKPKKISAVHKHKVKPVKKPVKTPKTKARKKVMKKHSTKPTTTPTQTLQSQLNTSPTPSTKPTQSQPTLQPLQATQTPQPTQTTYAQPTPQTAYPSTEQTTTIPTKIKQPGPTGQNTSTGIPTIKKHHTIKRIHKK